MRGPYDKPPITEAVIEIRIGSEISTKTFEKITKAIGREYPIREETRAVTLKIDATGQRSDVSHELHGYKLSSTDLNDVVMLRPQGITVSRLSPYTNWEHMMERIDSAWSIWLKSIGHRQVTRVGIRYINRIDIPAKADELLRLEDYFKTYPNLSPEIKTGISNFAMNIDFPLSDNWEARIISSTVLSPPLINHVSIILDIDVHNLDDIPQKKEELLDMIDSARDKKNNIFEGCITDKTRELFMA